MTDSNDSAPQPDDAPPPGHPAAAGDALSAGEVISGASWQASGAVGGSPRPDTGSVPRVGDDRCPTDAHQPDLASAVPDASEDDEHDAASDIAEFLDVDPPASPASESDAAAPG